MLNNLKKITTNDDVELLARQMVDELLRDSPPSEELIKWLRKAAVDPEAVREFSHYKYKPVSPREFLTEPHFLDLDPEELWESTIKAVEDICNGYWVEAVLTGGIGVAKCLAPGTPVLMFDGTTRLVEDVCVGDLLMGPDSQPRRVKSLASGSEEMFRVDQKVGDPYVVNRSHILSLQYTDTSNVKASGKSLCRYGAKKGDVLNISVEDYLNLSARHRALLKGWRPRRIDFPSAAPVDYPYFLGVWLGDGDSVGPTITTMEPEVVEHLQFIAQKFGLFLKETTDPRGSLAKRYRLVEDEPQRYGNKALNWLRSLGVVDNKHVPAAYRTASYSDRLEMLAGILDADGYLKNNCFSIVQVRKNLHDDIVFIARSCGLAVSTKVIHVKGKPYYKAIISGDLSIIPNRVARRKASARSQVKDVSRHGVTVTSLGEGDYFGFELDGPDRLFMLGDFTVTHNTTIALYVQAYQVYLLSCMRAPHRFLEQSSSHEILIVFQSLSGKAAKDLDYARFKRMIDKSPYFKAYFPPNSNITSELQFPNNVIVRPISGEETGAIGQNVIGGIIDEINSMRVTEQSKRSRDRGVHDQAVKNYNSIASRRFSRFSKKGWMPGMLCLVSSRIYPGEFTERKEQEARKKDSRIYVYDEVLWNIRPDKFGKARFKVFIGDATRKPRILNDNEKTIADDKGLVRAVPVEYRSLFENDLLGSLREVAGVATQALYPFIMETERLSAAFGKVQSIASRPDVDFNSSLLKLFPKLIIRKDLPRFAHIDLARTRDSCGLSIGFVPKFMNVDREHDIETLPIIQLDMILEIKPPKGGEIEFSRVRKVLYACRDLGLNIKWVTSDTWQSDDTTQILSQQGFITGKMSTDTDNFAYELTKQAFYDGRIWAPEHTKCQHEFATLERNPKTQAIDHPPNGSKDCSDSVAGVVHGLTMRREVWLSHNVPLTRVPQRIAVSQTDVTQTVQGGDVVSRIRRARKV